MKIIGVGAAVPARRVPNAEVEARLGLDSGWIERRTGIRERPTALPSEATSDFAVEAAAGAIAQSGVDPKRIGLLLLATSTPDHLLPPTAPLVAHRLGLAGAGAVDLAGACSGFIYALVLASHWVNGTGKAAVVIGANVLTRRVRPDDPATASLFSDGAGAVVLDRGHPTRLRGSYLGSDGSAYDMIGIAAGGTRDPLTAKSLEEGRHLMAMPQGKNLFRHAVQGMADAGKAALAQAGISAADVDWWVPHQANARVLRDVGALLGIPPERTVNVVADYGNSSAATIPIALADSDRKGLLKPGQTLLLTAAGAGLITAGVVLRW